MKLLKNEGRIEKKKKRATRKNKLLFAELEAAIRENTFKRPKLEGDKWAPTNNLKIEPISSS